MIDKLANFDFLDLVTPITLLLIFGAIAAAAVIGFRIGKHEGREELQAELDEKKHKQLVDELRAGVK